MSDDTQSHYEYGYRLEDGREVWEIDHGTDGAWTPYDEESGVRDVDMWDDGGNSGRIRAALLAARVSGVPLRRMVTVSRGPAEEVPE